MPLSRLWPILHSTLVTQGTPCRYLNDDADLMALFDIEEDEEPETHAHD